MMMKGSEAPREGISLDRVAVALDTADRSQFSRWCAFFGPRVGMLKVGLEAFCRWGGQAVEEAARHGRRVFLDLKLHDIPNTVAGATRIVRDSGAGYLTVHASGGAAMVAAATEAAGPGLVILAVTLLTPQHDGAAGNRLAPPARLGEGHRAHHVGLEAMLVFRPSAPEVQRFSTDDGQAPLWWTCHLCP